MEFNTGDKVKLVNGKDLNVSGASFTEGNIYTVVRGNHGYSSVRVEDDNGRDFGLYRHRFELVNDNGVDTNNMPKNFTKADLKPCMRVVFEGAPAWSSGGSGIVIVDADGEIGIACREGGWANVYFDEDGTFTKFYNIVEVYAAPPLHGKLDHDARGALLWRRVDKRAAIEAADAAVAEAEAALAAAKAVRAAL